MHDQLQDLAISKARIEIFLDAPVVWVVKLLKIEAPTAAFMLLQNGIVAF